MKSRMFANGSCLPERSARRKATVTISLPLATNASRIRSLEANLPMPTSNRELNYRSAIFNFEGLSDIVGNNTDFLVRIEFFARLSCDEIRPTPRRLRAGDGGFAWKLCRFGCYLAALQSRDPLPEVFGPRKSVVLLEMVPKLGRAITASSRPGGFFVSQYRREPVQSDVAS